MDNRTFCITMLLVPMCPGILTFRKYLTNKLNVLLCLLVCFFARWSFTAQLHCTMPLVSPRSRVRACDVWNTSLNWLNYRNASSCSLFYNILFSSLFITLFFFFFFNICGIHLVFRTKRHKLSLHIANISLTRRCSLFFCLSIYHCLW